MVKTTSFPFLRSEGKFVHLQIVGDIKAAREVLVEVTSRLRSYLYREFFPKDVSTPMAAPSPVGSAVEAAYNNNVNPTKDPYSGNDLPTASSQNVQTVATAQPTKVFNKIICLFI